MACEEPRVQGLGDPLQRSCPVGADRLTRRLVTMVYGFDGTIETLWDEWTIPKESGKKQDLEEDILSWRSKELTNTIENQLQDKIHKQL